MKCLVGWLFADENKDCVGKVKTQVIVFDFLYSEMYSTNMPTIK